MFLFLTEVCPLLVIGSPDPQHGAAKQVSSQIISSPGAFRKLLQFIQLIAIWRNDIFCRAFLFYFLLFDVCEFFPFYSTEADRTGPVSVTY